MDICNLEFRLKSLNFIDHCSCLQTIYVFLSQKSCLLIQTEIFRQRYYLYIVSLSKDRYVVGRWMGR